MNLFSPLALVALISLIHIIPSRAQDDATAPTLQIGLSGMSFSRGDLDAALVAEIIAEKQKEVKIKLIKTMLLKQLGVDNGLFYAFIDQNIEILLTEKDENTRVKNLLENVVNLSFVVGYADYYLQTLRINSPEWRRVRELAVSYGLPASLFEGRVSLMDIAKLRYRPINNSNSEIQQSAFSQAKNDLAGIIIDLFAEVIRQNDKLKSLGLLRTNYLQNYISMNSYLALTDEGGSDATIKTLIDIRSLLLDAKYNSTRALFDRVSVSLQNGNIAVLSADDKSSVTKYLGDLEKSFVELHQDSVLSFSLDQNFADPFLIRKARLQTNPQRFLDGINNAEAALSNASAANRGEAEQQVNWLRDFVSATIKNQIIDNAFNTRTMADSIFADVSKNLGIYMKYYGLIKTLSAKGQDWNLILNTISQNFQACDLNVIRAEMTAAYGRARNQIGALALLTEQERKDLENTGSLMEKLKYVALNRYEYMQLYETEIRPGIARLSKYSQEFLAVSEQMGLMLNCISASVRDDLTDIGLNLDHSFIKIFIKIDEFDKASTYAAFIDQLADAGDVFSDEEMRKSINKVLSFVRSYVKVENDQGQLTLNLDVEGFLSSMQRLPFNKFHPLQLHFTVGTNNASFYKSLNLDDGTSIDNFSYVSEKIGIKFKLMDFKYKNSFSKGETFQYYWKRYVRNVPARDPVVSNIHLLVYGSGLLYNIVNTSNSFHEPLVGAGAGITFFNDLDFNVTWGKPIMPHKNFWDGDVPVFLNIGFDIQFFEYYNRLQQKRKTNKTQKRLIEAKKNN